MYNVVEVIGSGMPSQNASTSELHPAWRSTRPHAVFTRRTPQAAVGVLMRRVSPKHSERELYMYDVTMVKDPKPQGFVTFDIHSITPGWHRRTL
jgi:hypothetical protein